ncbi:uncharacterized protein involved in outer membrane biogenesis [Parvibaculum indicum]|uniref:AsmA family protein n=1 Tax=Parvibaculum indicum TaxID=562969 RepID=UPI00141F4028|nr:AsmA family protein [Parvibaculum indicum]NIJ41023.1 uncharacterized protein involved in outer membrane biogenesis [Parvibaculum indicum]
MNQILTYIAGVLVVLLIALLVGPSLVDWKDFRAEFERQASRITGHDVTIEGDIGFRILPAPRLSLGRVTIANAPGAEAPALMRMEQMDGELALAPLLSGDIEVTRINIVKPRVNLEVAPDGVPNWKDFVEGAAASEEGAFSLSSTSLKGASFSGGSVTYVNRTNGRTWEASNLGGTVSAQALVGPMRADVTFVSQGMPMSANVVLGNFGGSKAFPVTLELGFPASQAAFKFSGIATEFSAAARLDGKASLRLGTAQAGKASPVSLQAGMVARSSSVTLRDMVLSSGGTSLKGRGQLDLTGERPAFEITLGGGAFRGDRLAAILLAGRASGSIGDEASGTDGAAAPFALLNRLPHPAGIDGALDISAGELLLGDSVFADAKAELALDHGTWRIGRLSAEAPGLTDIRIGGLLTAPAEANAVPAFDGEFSLASRDLEGFTTWLRRAGTDGSPGTSETADAPESPSPPISFSVTGGLALTPSSLSVKDLKAGYSADTAQPEVVGDMSYVVASRPRLSAELEASSFDLDPLLAMLPKDEAKTLPFFRTHDVALQFTADELTVAGETAKNISADGTLENRRLTVKGLAIGDLKGGAIGFSGRLDGLTTGRREDIRGTFSGSVKAARFGALLDMAGYDVHRFRGDVDTTFEGTTGEADDSDRRVDALTMRGMVSGARVDGLLKRHHGDGGKLDEVEIIANAAHPDARELLRQFGLEPADTLEGSGAASIRMDGVGGNYETSLRAHIGDASFTAEGETRDPFSKLHFDGKVTLSAGRADTVTSAFGATGALSDWMLAQMQGAGFVGSTGLEWDKTHLVLTDLETVAGNFRLSGKMTYTAPAEDRPADISGEIETNRLDVTPLAGLAGGADSATGSVWSAQAIDWRILHALTGDIELKSGLVTLGPLAMKDAEGELGIADGVMSVSPLVGEIAGGRASMNARFHAGGGEQGVSENRIEFTGLVEEADLARLSGQAFGASPGTGRATVNLHIEAKGLSWLSLVGSASGEGRVALEEVALHPLDVNGFGDALARLEDIEGFDDAVKNVLLAGKTPAGDIAGPLALEDGVLFFKDEDVALRGGKGKLAAFYDLSRLGADAELTVTSDRPADSPSYAVNAAGPHGGIAVSTNTARLESHVASLILARQAEKLGVDLPADIRNMMEPQSPTDGEGAANDNGEAGRGDAPMPVARPSH